MAQTFEIPIYGEPSQHNNESFSFTTDEDPYTSSLRNLPQDYEKPEIKVEEYYDNNLSRVQVMKKAEDSKGLGKKMLEFLNIDSLL